jgi:TolB-like protein
VLDFEWLANHKSAITTISGFLLIAGFLVTAARSRRPIARIGDFGTVGGPMAGGGDELRRRGESDAARGDPAHLPPAPGVDPRPMAAPVRPALAVLPFEVVGDAADGARLAGELYDDILILLAQGTEIAVIGRNALDRPAHANGSLRALGQELGVRYSVTGDLRLREQTWRLTIRLLDAATGGSLWAKNFELAVGMRGEESALVKSVAGAIAAEVLRAEALRSLRQAPEELDARALVHRAWLSFPAFTRRSYHEIDSGARLAIELEPGYPGAYGILAGALALKAQQPWSDTPEDDLAEAFSAGSRAVELSPGDPRTLHWWGLVHLHSGRTSEAVGILKEALLKDSAFAPAYADLGTALILSDDPAGGLVQLEQALALAPDHALAFMFHLWRGIGLLELRDQVAAEPSFRQSIASNVIKNPAESAAAFWAWVGVASAQAAGGNRGEAAAVLAKLRDSLGREEVAAMLARARATFAPRLDRMALVRLLGPLLSEPRAEAEEAEASLRRSPLQRWFQRPSVDDATLH